MRDSIIRLWIEILGCGLTNEIVRPLLYRWVMAFEFGTTDPAGDHPDAGSTVMGFDMFAPLAELSPQQCINTAVYAWTMNAVGICNVLMAASLTHERREAEYLLRRSAIHTGEIESVDDFAGFAADAVAGRDPYEEYGPNGFEAATAELGAALHIPPAQARHLIRLGDTLRYRMPLTGSTLACARIDLHHFEIAVRRTDFVDDAAMTHVDAALAEAILARNPMSTARFTVMVDHIVQKHAPETVKRRNEHAARDREITIRPDRYQPGRARISGHVPMVDAAAVNARLTAMAEAVHKDDPRTMAQRRADALLALANDQKDLDCLCPDCTAEPASDEPVVDATVAEPANPATQPATAPDTAADDTAVTAPGNSVSPTGKCTCACPGCRAPKPSFYIVGNMTTRAGGDDDPGMLDGYGLVDADTMRRLFGDAITTFIATGVRSEPSAADARAAATYVPSKKLQALVRAGELCCAFPGCNQPVWTVDLDHTHPFDHRNPEHGGKTVQRNLKPLCRFHHRIKTFGQWKDAQDEYLAVWFEAPTGHRYLGNPYTGRDLFTALKTQPPDHPARQRLADERAARTDTHRRKHDEWDRDNPPPF